MSWEEKRRKTQREKIEREGRKIGIERACLIDRMREERSDTWTDRVKREGANDVGEE